MHFCELTPGSNRGIVHLQLVLKLKDFQISFDRQKKLILLTSVRTEDSFSVCPEYSYNLLEQQKIYKGNCYKFNISLALPQELNYLRENPENNNSPQDSQDILTNLIYINNKAHNILKPLLNHNYPNNIVNSPWNSDYLVNCVDFVNCDYLVNSDYLVNCVDFVILGDVLQGVSVRSVGEFHLLQFRILIEFDPKLSFITLLSRAQTDIQPGSCGNSVKPVDCLVRCKRCDNLLRELTAVRLILLPSDLYLNSIGSIYCEECQPQLTQHTPKPTYHTPNPTHHTPKPTYHTPKPTHRKLAFISDTSLILQHNTGNTTANSVESTGNTGNTTENSETGERIGCEKCGTELGVLEEGILYDKSRVSLIVDGIDIFYRFSDVIDTIEKVQFDPRLTLKLCCNSESISIIKASKDPDTFILTHNNPVITTRILYTHCYSVNSVEGENSVTSDSYSVYTLDECEFSHIKLLLFVFSYDLNSQGWISSLLPQL